MKVNNKRFLNDKKNDANQSKRLRTGRMDLIDLFEEGFLLNEEKFHLLNRNSSIKKLCDLTIIIATFKVIKHFNRVEMKCIASNINEIKKGN